MITSSKSPQSKSVPVLTPLSSTIMRVKNSTDHKIKPSSQQRLFDKMSDVMKVSMNFTTSPAHRSTRASHADPLLATSVLNATSSQARRFARASDDPLSAAIDKMQMIARLTTGIHIQNGLLSGSIKPDDLVPELLRLGSVTPTQIIDMDSVKLASAMTAIKELPGKLKEDASTKRTEEKLAATNVMRDMVKSITDDITKWPGKSEFEAEMDKVKTNGVDVTIPDNVISTVKSWIQFLKSVKNTKLVASDQQSVSKMNFLVNDLNQFSSDLLTSITTLTSTSDPKPWKYPKITSATDALTSIINVVNSVEKAVTTNTKLSFLANDYNDFKNYETTLKSLSDVSKAVADVSSDLQTVVSVTKSRGSSVVKSPGFPGFPNGYSDMETLLVDLTDAWLSQIADAGNMEAALKPLQGLVSAFEKVDKTLGRPGDAQKKALLDYFELVNGIQKVPQTHTDIDSSMAKYADCSGKLLIMVPATVQPILEFIASAENLDKAIGNVDSDVQRLIGLLDTPDIKAALQEVKTTAQSSTDAAVLGQTVQKLTTSPTIDKLNTVLVDAEKIYFDVVPKIKTAAADVHSKIGSVEVFQKSLTNYPAYFICLRDQISEDMADKIRSVVGMAEKFRGGVDRKVLTDGEALVKSLLDSSTDFKDLKTSIENLKGKSSDDTKLLEALPTSDKHSKTIGLATLGVSNMEMALEAKAQADVVVRNSGVVEKQMKMVKDPKHAKNLGEVVGLKSTLPTMYQQLDAWKSGVKPTDSTVLASFSDLYTSAKSVSGITGDFGAMAKSVEALASKVTHPTDKATLIAVQKALEKLNTIDLDFAAYSTEFDASKDTLTALDLFFVDSKTLKTTAAPKIQSGKNTSQSPPLASGQVGTLATTEAPSDPTTTYIIVGCVVGVLAVGGTIAGGLVYWKKKKDKKVDSEKPKPGPDSKPEPPGPPPAPPVPATTPDAAPTPAPNAAPTPAPEVPAPAPEVPPNLEPTQNSELDDVHFDSDAATRVMAVMKARFMAFKGPADDTFEEQFNRKPVELRMNKRPETMSWNEAMAMDFDQMWTDIERYRGTDQDMVAVNDYKKETRKRIPLLKATRVKLTGYGKRFTNDYIHASTVTYYSGLRMILTQSPMTPSDGRVSTVEKFWWMTWKSGAKFIVMLNTDNGGDVADDYFPKKKGETMKFKKLKVKCLDAVYPAVLNDRRDPVITRRLRVQFDNEKAFEVTHMQHVFWYSNFAPYEPTPVVKMLKAVRLSKDPVIVHCTDGASRSGCFALIELGYQEIARNADHQVDLVGLVHILRSMRCWSINQPIQVAFAITVILEMLAKEPCKQFQTWYQEYHDSLLTVDQPDYATRTKAGLESIKKMLFGWLPDRLKMSSKPRINEHEAFIAALKAIKEEKLAADLAEHPEMLALELLLDMQWEEARQQYHEHCCSRRVVEAPVEQMRPRPADQAIQIEPLYENIV